MGFNDEETGPNDVMVLSLQCRLLAVLMRSNLGRSGLADRPVLTRNATFAASAIFNVF